MKSVTCGIILHDSKRFLSVHPTLGDYWSIPKGIAESHEPYTEAAIRELKEETGYIINNFKDLKYIYYGSYKKKQCV
jgi:ADP-ribose pyrophosphatase YjhB (NUDIX family)